MSGTRWPKEHSDSNVHLEQPSARREQEFLRCVRKSRDLHRGRVTPPNTSEKYRDYLRRVRKANQATFFVALDHSDEIAGVIDIGNIVRGYFQSAYLGYYAFVPFAGSGYMRKGLHQVITYAFRKLKLHRLEANIQPDNERSIALVSGLGFKLEGVSPRYLKVCGRWKDHERWAILSEGWKPHEVA